MFEKRIKVSDLQLILETNKLDLQSLVNTAVGKAEEMKQTAISGLTEAKKIEDEAVKAYEASMQSASRRRAKAEKAGAEATIILSVAEKLKTPAPAK
jgi:hypothetical protein